MGGHVSWSEAALEVENLARELRDASEFEKVAGLIQTLSTDLAESPLANLRKGALHALAGTAIGLGPANVTAVLPALLSPQSACGSDLRPSGKVQPLIASGLTDRQGVFAGAIGEIGKAMRHGPQRDTARIAIAQDAGDQAKLVTHSPRFAPDSPGRIVQPETGQRPRFPHVFRLEAAHPGRGHPTGEQFYRSPAIRQIAVGNTRAKRHIRPQQPVPSGGLRLSGAVVWTGRSSMQIRVVLEADAVPSLAVAELSADSRHAARVARRLSRASRTAEPYVFSNFELERILF